MVAPYFFCPKIVTVLAFWVYLFSFTMYKKGVIQWHIFISRTIHVVEILVIAL